MRNQKGLIQLVLLIVVGLILLGYFGLNLKEILASPVVRANLVYAWELWVHVWKTYLAGPAGWVIEHVFKFLWQLVLKGVGGGTVPNPGSYF